MLKNILNLLILCGILCQGMSVTSAEADIGKPSDVLVRHKRVFDATINREESALLQEAPYVVNIKTKNGLHEVSHCVGSIITAHALITAAQCAGHSINEYIIYSGAKFSHNGTEHRVINKKIHLTTKRPNSRLAAGDGIALMFVEPHFTISFTSPSSSTGAGFIAIRHNRPIQQNSFGTISGWGYKCTTQVLPERIAHLQTITVRVMENEDCSNYWRGYIDISSTDICTYDPTKRCGHSDLGAPLVVDRQLVGVHVIDGGVIRGQPQRPDIFAYLDHEEYINWIRANINPSTN